MYVVDKCFMTACTLQVLTVHTDLADFSLAVVERIKRVLEEREKGEVLTLRRRSGQTGRGRKEGKV